jgi:hypothetical protein
MSNDETVGEKLDGIAMGLANVVERLDSIYASRPPDHSEEIVNELRRLRDDLSALHRMLEERG